MSPKEKNAVARHNAFGSGSFLVAAAMEGRRYIGIEKNEEVHLFRNERIDYMKVAHQRLVEVENDIAGKNLPPPLLSSLQPSARIGQVGDSCMIDVNSELDSS